MLALTIYQPWALLLVSGQKKHETRPKRTNVRGWVAIHASKKAVDARVVYRQPIADALLASGATRIEELTTSAIIGLVEIVDCQPTDRLKPQITTREESFGNWGPDRYAWTIGRRRRLAYPVPATGRQGWWAVSDSQIELLGQALKLGGQMDLDMAVALNQRRYQPSLR